jgi:hypothetical protein
MRFEIALAGLQETRVLLPGTCGRWLVKEEIAHAMWDARGMVDVIRQRELIRKVFLG